MRTPRSFTTAAGTLAAAALAGVLILAACTSSPARTGPTSTPAISPTPPSVMTLGQSVCPGLFVKDTDPELFAREAGGCPSGVRILTFNTTGGRDGWVQTAEAYGGIIVPGPLWVVTGADQAAVDRAVKAIR